MDGVKVLVTDIFKDERGFFAETYKQSSFKGIGITEAFVQSNHSKSNKGIIRGLHFQWDPPASKLMRVTVGEAMLVAVDIRIGSPTFGEWIGVYVSDKNRYQVYAPAGFARGFRVISDVAEIQYKCTGEYNPKGESNILWNDPEIRINWGIANPMLSDKDKSAQTLKQWLAKPESLNFVYKKIG